MQKIEFDEGYRTYQIGNDEKRVIRIRLDPDLIIRIKDAEKKITELEDRLKNTSVDDLTFLSNEMKTIINDAFKTDICEPVFEGANIFTLVSSGKTLFQSFFDAFMPVLEADIKAFEPVSAAPRPEVQQYLKEKKPALDIGSLTADEKRELLEKLLK
ncbi:MAG: hypothetical protein J6Y64_00495 [Ruminococcus sp.]|nr:hypothetical protein [Ruminococcus sp.]